MLVGLFVNVEFDEVEFMLVFGDRLFISLDGLMDSENLCGEMLGDEGL